MLDLIIQLLFDLGQLWDGQTGKIDCNPSVIVPDGIYMMRCHTLCWPFSPAAMMDLVSAVCGWAQLPRTDAVIALGKLSERIVAGYARLRQQHLCPV